MRLALRLKLAAIAPRLACLIVFHRVSGNGRQQSVMADLAASFPSPASPLKRRDGGGGSAKPAE